MLPIAAAGTAAVTADAAAAVAVLFGDGFQLPQVRLAAAGAADPCPASAAESAALTDVLLSVDVCNSTAATAAFQVNM